MKGIAAHILFVLTAPCALAAAIAFAPQARAAAAVELSPEFREVRLGPRLEILEDREGALALGDVAGGRAVSRFHPSPVDYPSFGFTGSVIWARFGVVNRTKKDIPFYLEFSYPHLDRIGVYRISPRRTVVDRRVAGDLFPFTTREKESENFVFPFVQEKKSGDDYYVRIATSGALNVHCTLWSPEAFRSNQIRMYIIYAVYYGAMIIMVLYNLFIFISLRDRSYLFYVLYCLAFILLELNLNGLAFRFFWPASPWLANHSLPPSILLSVMLAVMFVRDFLETRNYDRRLDRALFATGCVLAALVPVSLMAAYRTVLVASIAIMLAAAIFIYVAAVRVLLLGNRAARLYLITWAAFWVGAFVYSLKMFGVLPESVVTRWVLQATSLSQVVLLSLALVDRIHFMKEKLESLNVSLESKVHDRTAELNHALDMMEKKDSEIQKEFELAGTIQQGILPGTPHYQDGVRVVAHYRAMGKVGGDFYDLFQMKGGYIGVLIADASGHGMPAAFITAMAKISFAEAIQSSLFPADIFRHVNDELIKTIKTDDYVTAFFIVISPAYDVFYCNASHPMAMVLRRDTRQVELWDTNGLFMGAMPIANQMYEDGQSRLDYGDRILLYTDGITGAFNRSGEKYGEERLQGLFIESAEMTLGEARDLIVRSCEEFARGTEQTDDMTLVMLEIDPAYRDLIEYRDQGFKLMWRRRYREAVEVLEKALAINPSDEKSHLYAGECYLKSGNFTRAAEHLQLYLQNNEFDANVWCNLARAYFCVADAQNAYRAAMKASGLKGNFIDAMVVAGLALRDMGDGPGAWKMWERILALDPDNEIALVEMREPGDG